MKKIWIALTLSIVACAAKNSATTTGTTGGTSTTGSSTTGGDTGTTGSTTSSTTGATATTTTGSTTSGTTSGTAPTATVVPASGSTINGQTPIVIQFTGSMNPAAPPLAIGGSLGAVTATWDAQANANDRLTLTPTTAWVAGSQTLIIDGQDPSGNAIANLSLTFEVDSTQPTAAASPASGDTIPNDFVFRLYFDESMDPTSHQVGGTLAAAPSTVTWESYNFTNDVLVIAPSASWATALGQTLEVRAADLAGNLSDSISATYDVREQFHVDVVGAPDDSGDGTRAHPLKTIQAAIALASAESGSGWKVLVAAGTYATDSRVNQLKLANGVSVYGGYDASDWDATPDPAVNVCTITDSAGGIAYTVLIDSDVVDSKTTFSGFTVSGSTTTGGQSRALQIVGRATIENNEIIIGGSASSPTTYGIATFLHGTTIRNNHIVMGQGSTMGGIIVVSGGADIDSNVIDLSGSSSTSSASAIRVINGSNPTISNNTLIGGNGPHSYGIESLSSEGFGIYSNTISGGAGTLSVGIHTYSATGIYRYQIMGNVIDAGSGSAASTGLELDYPWVNEVANNVINGGGGTESFGIVSAVGASRLYNNTVDAGSGAASYAIIAKGGSTPEIVNNVIFSTNVGANGFCIYEQASGSDPTRVANNDLYGCATLYHDFDTVSVDYTSLADVNDATKTTQGAASTASANISVDALVDGDGHLGTTDLAVLLGGLNGAEQAPAFWFPNDLAGTPRTGNAGPDATGWTMGAYEVEP